MSAAVRFALEVALAWLMPWRAVREIRGQREDIALVIRALARVLEVREGRQRHLHLVK